MKILRQVTDVQIGNSEIAVAREQLYGLSQAQEDT
jgi:hypothetical protein